MVLIAILFLVNVEIPFAGPSVPQNIKIGLRYSSGAVSSSNLTATGNLGVYQIYGDSQGQIASLESGNYTVSKPTGSFIIISTQGSSSFDSAKSITNNSGLKNSFVYFDGSFKAGAGPFNSNYDANVLIQSSGLDGNFEVVNIKSSDIMIKSSLNTFVYDSSKELGFTDEQDEIINMEGRNYRGFALYKRNSGNLTVINRLKLEDYLRGVVPNEIGKSVPLEAMKAQAVAARNYAVSSYDKFKNYGFNLDTTTLSQVYRGYDSESSMTNKAIDETRGVLMLYGNDLVQAVYHSNSGGKTTSSELEWGGKFPYLVGVNDPYSIGAPNDTWYLQFSRQDLENKLLAQGVNIGELRNITIDSKTIDGRVTKITFWGSKGSKVYQKSDVKKIFGTSQMKSNFFEILYDQDVQAVQKNSSNDLNIITKKESNSSVEVYDPKLTKKYIQTAKGNQTLPPGKVKISSNTQVRDVDIYEGIYVKNDEDDQRLILPEFQEEINQQPIEENNNQTGNINTIHGKYVVRGHGWGHGVGMSQWGAINMAKKGFTYDQILKHYYTGVQLTN